MMSYLRHGKGFSTKDEDDGIPLSHSIQDKVDADLQRFGTMRQISTVTRGNLGYPSGDVYASPAASQAMLDDMAFDLETWLANEISSEFSRAENPAFVIGSGVDQPKGFMTYPTSLEADEQRDAATIQHVSTTEGNTLGDDLVDLIHSLNTAYRQEACFIFNSLTCHELRRLKTADGAFLWQSSLVQDQPNTLLGYPVAISEDMPDIGPGACSIAFGNFRAGYAISESHQTHILRDPFSNKPFVHFYATKRVGGDVVNFAAIKLLRFPG